MVAAAAVGSAFVGAAASSSAGRRAAAATESASRRASDTELAMFDQTREDLAPYRAVGQSALARLSSMYGLDSGPSTPELGGAPQATPGQPMTRSQFLDSDLYNSESTMGARGTLIAPPSLEEQYAEYTNNFSAEEMESAQQQAPDQATALTESAQPDYSAFYESPDYQFALDQGTRGVDQMLAKKGLVGSGAEMKAISRFNQGLASQTFNNYRNSLQAMAGIGQTATNTTGTIGTQVASNVGANQRMAGDARASSYLNTGAAISNAADSYGQYRMLQAGGYTK